MEGSWVHGQLLALETLAARFKACSLLVEASSEDELSRTGFGSSEMFS